MTLNYDKFCSLPAYVVSVKQLTESRKRFRHTREQLNSIGISTVHKAKAVFVQDHKLVKSLVNRYGLHNFKGRDTHLACTLSFIRLHEHLLNTKEEFFLTCEDDLLCVANDRALFKEYFDQLPDNWDVLHLGASVTKQASDCNQTKNFIRGIEWCTTTNKPLNSSQIWVPSNNENYIEPPWGGVMGGWCNIYNRKALKTFIENAKSIFTVAGDVANNIAYRDFGLNFLCINRPAEHVGNCNLNHRKTGKNRRLIGLIFQANFKSLNDKYSTKFL
jgi:GR25 family glycosyltransferase involved in LPS biosynthesis